MADKTVEANLAVANLVEETNLAVEVNLAVASRMVEVNLVEESDPA